MFKIKGYVGAMIELLLYFIVSYVLRKHNSSFQQMDTIMYYWFCFSVLTGFWECVYVTQFLKVVKTSQILVETNTHVWTNSYGLSMILPWNLSKIFYAEYAAYADREYMTRTDYWSRLIESSHALLCATFSLLSLCFQNKHLFYYSAIAGAVGMGQQFMNRDDFIVE